MNRGITKSLMSVAVAGVMAFSTTPVWAETRIHEAARSERYGRKFGGMLGRGALNVLTSFVGVVVNTVNETRDGAPVVGTLTGLGKGLGCGLLRFGSGAVDLTTFWVPGFNGIPVSSSYQNCLEEESYSEGSQPSQQGYYSQPAPMQPVQRPVITTPAEPEEQSTPPKVWKK